MILTLTIKNMKTIQLKHLFLVVGFLLPYLLSAQVVINEFSPSNVSDFEASWDEYPDWIELYNTGNTTVDLSGYFLSDKVDEPQKWEIPAGTTIAADDHLVILATGDDGIYGGDIHANFKLTQMKQEFVILADPDGNILDAVQMLNPTWEDHARGRITDGDPTWGVTTTPSPGGANNNYFSEYEDRPVFSQSPGFYNGSVSVELYSENNTIIRYTTNGLEPDESSAVYNSPITINSTTVLKAKTFPTEPDKLRSFTTVATYFIDEEHTLPVFSVSSERVFNLLEGLGLGPSRDYITHTEYFENEERVFNIKGHFRSHGNDSWALDQRGIRFYAEDDYGYANKVDHKLFPTSDREEFDVFILKASASDSYPSASNSWGRPSCHLRDAYVQQLSDVNDLNVDERRYRRCIMYVNGEYWGIYELRERIDNDYTKYYYDQGRKWVDMLEYWGSLEERYGSSADWETLYDFMLNNDLSIPANYAYVEQELDISSMIDYIILNTFVVNTDWLNWNTKWWRGTKAPGTKWRYCLWDMDNVFGLGQNYTGLPDVSWQGDPCDIEGVFGSAGDPDVGHIEMLVALFENEDFVQQYINRYADLAATTFSCESMLGLLDEMVAEIEPEMPRQVARWGGSMAEWQENLDSLRSQIENKCVVITDQLLDCYEDEGITGPFDVVVDVFPPGAGQVQINTAIGTSYPWNVTYFGGIEINLTALPGLNYAFQSWTVANNTFGPDALNEAISMSLESGDNIVANFIENNCGIEVEIAGNSLVCEDEVFVLDAGGGFMSYVWSDNSTGQTLETNEPGNYSVTVTNDDVCFGVASISISVYPESDLQIIGSLSFCTGSSTGLAATPGFNSYEWANGSVTESIEVTEGGTYTVTAIDNNGCSVTTSVFVNEEPDLIPEILGPDSICVGTSAGQDVLSLSEMYQEYLWSDNSTGNDLTISTPGTYEVTVTNGAGCTGTTSFEVAANVLETIEEEINLCYGGVYNGVSYISGTTITEQLQSAQGCFYNHVSNINVSAELNLTLTENVSCDGTADLESNISGGTGSFDYEWSNGFTTPGLDNVAPGLYALTVTDDFGCTVVASSNIEPGQAIDYDASVESTSCPGTEDGQVTIEVLNGTPPYNINWSGGQSGSTLEDLSPGIYNFQIVDANNCNLIGSVTIADATPIDPNVSVVGTSTNTGSATSFTFGGQPPYNYQWSTGASGIFIDNLTQGTYTVTVTDANGCTGEEIFEVGEFTSTTLPNDIEKLDIFPNPSTGKFTVGLDLIQSQDVSLSIFNIQGQRVFQSLSNGNIISFNVNLEDHAAGTYLVMIKTKAGTVVRKIAIVE